MSIIGEIKNTPVLKPLYLIGRDIKMLGSMTESDKHYISKMYRKKFGYKPDLEHPKTFQEK